MSGKYWEADASSKLAVAHVGWYQVWIDNGSTVKNVKASSAFDAATQCGTTLSQCTTVIAVKCPECIYELEHGEVGPYSSHTCEEDQQ